jgi:surface protein
MNHKYTTKRRYNRKNKRRYNRLSKKIYTSGNKRQLESPIYSPTKRQRYDVTFTFTDNSKFREEFDELGIDALITKYGPLSSWKVDNITNMSGLFEGYIFKNFQNDTENDPKDDITKWEVHNVTTMEKMFKNCKSFNQNLGGWKVSKVNTMGEMFNGCEIFNQDLSGWDVSIVASMNKMFRGCSEFNQDLSKWDGKLTYVSNMDDMFSGCTEYNYPLNKWHVKFYIINKMNNILKNTLVMKDFIQQNPDFFKPKVKKSPIPMSKKDIEIKYKPLQSTIESLTQDELDTKLIEYFEIPSIYPFPNIK